MAITPQTGSQQKPVLTAKERLEHAQRELAQLRSRINRSTGMTAVVGIVALLLLAGYFYYGSVLWAEVSEPEGLVNLAQEMFDKSLPDARDALEKAVIKDAPGWAASLSKQLLASMPDGRKELEKFVVARLDESIRELELVTEAEFRKFLKKNRAMMEKRFKELESDDKRAEESVAELVAAVERDMQGNFKSDAALLLKGLKNLNRNARDIRSNLQLDEGQMLEREVWMLARALYLDAVDPALLAKMRASTKTQPQPVRAVPKRRPLLPKKDNNKPNESKPGKSGKTDQGSLAPLSLRHLSLVSTVRHSPLSAAWFDRPAAHDRCRCAG